ncbi:MAG: hypothetical protein COB53_06505 [Elusimicrobia bacterium]|nr:MAG: hypothetical protein COB53_06505 [Elusimicrobiota bacterium]
MDLSEKLRKQLKRITGFIAVLLILFGGFYCYVLVRGVPACPQNCSLLAGDNDCVPIELTLELGDAIARTNTGYSLWYRIGLKNTCCDRLSLDSVFLVQDWPLTALEIKIWGPDGKQVSWTPPLPHEERVQAYAFEKKSDPRYSQISVKVSDFGNSIASHEFAPGEYLLSTPSVFRPSEAKPHNRPDIDEELPGASNRGIRASLKKQRAARIQKALKSFKLRDSMPGYRVLEGFIFKHPGKYRIQAKLKDNAFVSRASNWDQKLTFPLDLMAKLILRRHGLIPERMFKEVEVEQSTGILEFEVKP